MIPQKRMEQLKELDEIIETLKTCKNGVSCLVVAFASEDSEGETYYTYRGIGETVFMLGLTEYIKHFIKEDFNGWNNLSGDDLLDKLKR